MLDPTSPPIKAFLKLQEIEQLNKSRRHHPETVSLQSSKPHQVLSPMAGAKSRAFIGNLEESKLGHKEEVLQEFLLLPGVCLQSSSQLSLLPLPRFELNLTCEKTSSTTQQEQNNDNNNNNNPSSSTRFQFSDPFEPSTDPNNNPQLNALPPLIKSSVLPEGTKIRSSMESSFGNFSQQPFTSAQKLLLFDLNHKRKLAAWLALLVITWELLPQTSWRILLLLLLLTHHLCWKDWFPGLFLFLSLNELIYKLRWKRKVAKLLIQNCNTSLHMGTHGGAHVWWYICEGLQLKSESSIDGFASWSLQMN